MLQRRAAAWLGRTADRLQAAATEAAQRAEAELEALLLAQAWHSDPGRAEVGQQAAAGLQAHDPRAAAKIWRELQRCAVPAVAVAAQQALTGLRIRMLPELKQHHERLIDGITTASGLEDSLPEVERLLAPFDDAILASVRSAHARGDADSARSLLEGALLRVASQPTDVATAGEREMRGADGPPREGEAFTNAAGIRMLWVQPGDTTVGSPESERGRGSHETQVTVKLARGYWLAEREVSNREWRRTWPPAKRDGTRDDDQRAAVTWGRAITFCELLTDNERIAGRLPEGFCYALPQEVEWEHACRAGTRSAYWFDHEADPNGASRANPWGFLGVHDEFLEWVDEPDRERPLPPGAPAFRTQPEDLTRSRLARGLRAAQRHVRDWQPHADVGLRPALVRR
jgi:formylglycine-generating enzyme required for sulfatase activity